MSSTLKQITKEVKFHLQTFDGQTLTLMKRPYQLTFNWYKNSEGTKPKCFIERDYDCSQPYNQHPMYKQHHKNGEPDPEVIINHDYLYATAWESKYETPIFNNSRHKPDNQKSPGETAIHDLTNNEACISPGTIQESCPEMFPRKDELCDGTDTDHYMDPDAEKSLEQLSPTNANSLITRPDVIYATILNRLLLTITDIKLLVCLIMVLGTTMYSIRPFVDFRKMLGNDYGATTYVVIRLLVGRRKQHQCWRFFPKIFLITEVANPRSSNAYPMYTSMPYGALPERSPKKPKNLTTDTIRANESYY